MEYPLFLKKDSAYIATLSINRYIKTMFVKRPFSGWNVVGRKINPIPKYIYKLIHDISGFFLKCQEFYHIKTKKYIFFIQMNSYIR